MFKQITLFHLLVENPKKATLHSVHYYNNNTWEVINYNTARRRRIVIPALECLQAARQSTIFLSDEASSIDFSRWDVKAVGRRGGAAAAVAAGDWDNDEDVGERADYHRWTRRQDNGPTCPAFEPVVSEGRGIRAGTD